jgi:putative PIN family toxin of toxin-antitoxin system
VKIVLDANILLSGIGWSGPPARILAALMDGTHSLVTSPALLRELTRTLRYPRLRRIAGLPSIPLVLAWLHQAAHVVVPAERIQTIGADPADNLVLEAAVAGKADAIVSGDHHLLELRAFRGIAILTAQQFATKYL